MSVPYLYDNPYPHKCRSRVNGSLKDQYCCFCGIAISANPAISYLRPFSYNQVNSYIGDQNLIIDNMIKKQTIHLHYSEEAFHIQFRQGLVDWLEKTARKLNLNISTTHLSIAIIDIVLSGYAIPMDKMEIMIFTALNIACKMNDRDDRLPCLKDVPFHFQKEISISELQNCEKIVFEVLSYNSNIQTAYGFACQFILCGVISNQDLKNNHTSYIMSEFERLMSLYASASIKNYELCQFEATTVGAAMIAGVRKTLGFQHVWTEHLEKVTRTTWDQLQDCMQILEETAFEIYGDELYVRDILPTPVKRKSFNTLISTIERDQLIENGNESEKQVFVSKFSFNKSQDDNSLKHSTIDEQMSKILKEL